MGDSPFTRRALDWLRATAPTPYWRARNLIALGELYAQRAGLTASPDAYDEAFWNSHGDGDWTGFARAVAARVTTRSVVDVGCGQGLTLTAFQALDPSIAVRGFDESAAALRRGRERGLPIERLDMLRLSALDARRVAEAIADFDLAICLEVAEHLPSWHVEKLLTIVSAPRRLVFSAAHPNQGGRFHVNEQPPEYWMKRLAAHGVVPAPGDEALRRDIAALDLPWWYARNVHLFERQPGSAR